MKTSMLLIFLLTFSITLIPQTNYPFNHIDVLNYKIEVDLMETFSSRTNYLKGNVEIICKTDTINLDTVYLNAVWIKIDSVFCGITKTEFIQTDSLLVIPLDRKYVKDEIITLHIYYYRPAGNTLAGFVFNRTNDFQIQDLAFNSSWPARTRFWLPCKDWPNDKATVETIIKVPSGITALSNGRLQERIDDSVYSIFKWKDKNPMAVYNVIITASEFISFNWKIPRYSNSTDSIDVVVYKYPQTETDTISINLLKGILHSYSGRFIEYPYDIISLVFAPGYIFMGYSTQTIIHIGFNGTAQYLLPHETAHQWFGSFINPADWNLWMTEGLANYAVYQYAEDQVPGWINGFLNVMKPSYLAGDTISIHNADYFSCGRIVPVLYMLEKIMGDSLYWKAFRKFLSDHAYSSPTPEEFIETFNTVSGNDYNWFFDQWYYGTGHPVYNISWGKEKIFDNYCYVNLNIDQTQTSREVFSMPLKFTFRGVNSDTTITVFNNQRDQSFHYRLNLEPMEVLLDKDSIFVLKEVTYSSTPFSLSYEFNLLQNFPNPFNPSTKIEYRTGSFSFVSIKLYDILGREVKTLVNEYKQSGIYGIEFNAEDLPSGVYFYRMHAGNFNETKKLILLK